MFAYFVTLPVLYLICFLVPFYKTFKAIEKLTSGSASVSTSAEGSSSSSSASSVSSEAIAEARRWLMYWIFAGLSQQLFQAYESRTNATFSLVYYLIKICWFVILSNPKYGNAAEMVYVHAITPTLGAHQDKIDKFVSEKCSLITNQTSRVVNQIKNRTTAPSAASLGGGKPSRLSTPPKKSH